MLLLAAGATVRAGNHPAPADTNRTAVAAAKPQTHCPVMGGKIIKKVFADHKGKRVYFCCAGCIPAFKKSPEKYIKKLEAAGIKVEAVPEKE
jgi:YHS domain-containing protein